MEHVQFNEENQDSSMLYGRFESSNKPPAMVNKLMEWGVVKSESQAKFILLGVVVAGIVVVAFAMFMRQEPKHKLDSTIDPKTGLEYGIQPPS